MTTRFGLRILLVVAAATGIGLFFLSETYMTLRPSGQKVPWGHIALFVMARWYLWAALFPLVLWLAKRLPLHRSRLAINLVILATLSGIFAIVHWFLLGSFARFVLGYASFPSIIFQLHTDLVTFWMVVAGSVSLDYYRRYTEGEIRSSQLAARLAETQLQVLRTQLNPHFLFNALNAICALVHSNPDAADKMLARLSELLRLTLDNVSVQEVSLVQEIEFLTKYIEIEQARFADRLSVEMSIEPTTWDNQVPYLVLQPLVENAIRHGILPFSKPGHIKVAARKIGEMLVLTVQDNGVGLPADGFAARVGLSSIRARLGALYGASHRFTVVNAPGGGVIATILMPSRKA